MRLKTTQSEQIRDYVLTAVFLVIGLILLITRNDGGLENMRKVSISALSYLDQPLSNVRIYREALQTNMELREQNVLLLDELSRLRSAREENEELRRLLDFSGHNEQDLYPVKIISKNLTGVNNSLTIDAGRNDSIFVGMPVVNSDGLVGRVILSSANYAKVMPFKNALFRVSARVQGSRAYGVVSWESDRLNELVMSYVPQTIFVTEGSIVETSGFSDQFPAQIPIGVVTRTVEETGRETQRIYLQPFVSLHEIAEAFVIRYETPEELEDLTIQFEEMFR